VEEMKKSCDSVRLQEFNHKWSSTGKTKTMWNIIGEQNWKDAKVRVILMAHWDSRPTSDQDSDRAKRKQPILGANDGASGVAVLLGLMQALKGKRPDLGIQYVLSDGEDLGPSLDEMFLGAKAYAKSLPAKSDPLRPHYGILLDMIGDKDLVVPVEPNSYRAAPELIKALYAHAKDQGLGATFPYEMGPEIMDDHLSVIDAGVPMIDLIDFDYDPWHTSRDTPDKCSQASLKKVGLLLETWFNRSPLWKPK
jgi:Zn-dependent M28 family amino/carboxypeptidase